MLWIISSAVFVAIALFTYGLATTYERRQRMKVRVGDHGLMAVPPLLQEKARASNLTNKFVEWLILSGQWALPDLEKVSEMRKDLIMAGYRHTKAPAIYLGLRILTAIAFCLPLLLYFVIKGTLNPINIFMAFVAALVGFFLPAKILAVKIRHRQEGLDRALPDILDMFVICMEAGLSVNVTINRVSDEIRGVYGDFSEELRITAVDLLTGIPWDEAFDNLVKRTGVASIRSMVSLMIQSNKLGSSICDALRNHAEFIRTQRLLRAEEKAAKLPIKMIFPLIFCIMPAIMIVVAGPGILHMLEKLLGSGGLLQSGSFGKFK